MLTFARSCALACWVLALPAVSAEDAIDFSRDVLPLLSNNCFQCHGPDAANRQAGLRLDVREDALHELDSGSTAIVPEHPDRSELLARITTDDPDIKMPPADSGKKLTARDVQVLQQWIQEGAGWGRHWAFEPPVARPVPEAVSDWRSTGPIDRFLHKRLQSAGLEPEPPAARETLIRRVTLDLTGLPPTIEEVDAFLADESPNAFEKVVDRLLASQRYGEHMARIWLDAARYGDTHGLHLDNERSIWPYRDWVIQSFNANQPFDQFTIEQIAGDLLPNSTLEQKVATGFNRCNVTTSEGGSIDEEYYVRYAVDRVETTSTVWLGLTAGCAACHDHKFDPLTQKEFYQLFSYYFSLTERAMDGNALLPPPSVKVPTAEQLDQKNSLSAELKSAEEKVAAALAEIAYVDPSPEKPLGDLVQADYVWIDDELPAGAKPQGNGPDPFRFVEGPDHPVHSGTRSTTRTGNGDEITQHFFTGATDKLKIEPGAMLFAYCYLDPKNPPQTVQLQFNDGSWDHRATWGADKAFLAGRNDAKNRQMGPLPATGKWVRLEVSAEAVGLKPGSELNGWAFTQVGGTVHWDTAGVVRPSLSEADQHSQFVWEQFAAKTKFAGVPEDVKKIISADAAKRNDQQKQQLTNYFLQHVHPTAAKKLAEPMQHRDRVQQQLAALEKQIPATLVMEERPEPRQAHILERGEYTLKRDPVQSAVPEWIAAPVPGAPENRLGLAMWLTQPSHPLTARVTVNRFWQQLFGIGLVRTAEDFGVQGEQPSHPELLDWLALDFIQSGWNVKQTLKQVVMSATYQQSSAVRPEKLQIDPENRLLARGPRFRLDAEVIRDQALAVSGLLIGRIGGKSVKPYQPAGLWKPVGFGGSNTATFVQDSGDKLFRRSMYTFWKRTVPPPSMATFDAPDRETCQVRRARTNTPLQALVLMNDVQYVEAARKFAEGVLRQSGLDAAQRVQWAVKSVLARQPTSSEQEALLQLQSEAAEQFAAQPEEAQKLLQAGEAPVDQTFDPVELASWTMVTHVILNLSETVTRN
ncbi:MAG: PSD1 and planctomycete cytochrome C domain-containing protein [Fuerstiella sp.]